MDMDNLTIAQLRAKGYLIVAWTPQELAGLEKRDIREIESQVKRYGNDAIYLLSPLVLE